MGAEHASLRNKKTSMGTGRYVNVSVCVCQLFLRERQTRSHCACGDSGSCGDDESTRDASAGTPTGIHEQNVTREDEKRKRVCASRLLISSLHEK